MNYLSHILIQNSKHILYQLLKIIFYSKKFAFSRIQEFRFHLRTLYYCTFHYFNFGCQIFLLHDQIRQQIQSQLSHEHFLILKAYQIEEVNFVFFQCFVIMKAPFITFYQKTIMNSQKTYFDFHFKFS